MQVNGGNLQNVGPLCRELNGWGEEVFAETAGASASLSWRGIL